MLNITKLINQGKYSSGETPWFSMKRQKILRRGVVPSVGQQPGDGATLGQKRRQTMTFVRKMKQAIEAGVDTLSPYYTVTHIDKDPWTFVRITVRRSMPPASGEGFARRCWKDEPDPDRGYEIAKGRAALDLAEQLIDRGARIAPEDR